MISICHIDMPLQAVAGITEDVGITSMTQVAKVLLEEGHLMVEALIDLRLQPSEGMSGKQFWVSDVRQVRSCERAKHRLWPAKAKQKLLDCHCVLVLDKV